MKKKLVELIDQIVLDEFNALGTGAVAFPGPAPLGMKHNIPKELTHQSKKQKRTRRVNEANTVAAVSAELFGNDDVPVDPDTEMSSTKLENPKKSPHFRHKKAMNLFQKLMWAGDQPVPNTLKVKYSLMEGVASEQKFIAIHSDKRIEEVVEDALSNFLLFCQKKLSLKDFPQIYLFNKRQPGMTTGAFLPGERIVFALIQNRLMLDVFRTLAHELTHCKQYDNGELDNLPAREGEDDMSDINTSYENEAYINAGNFVKEWSRIYKKIPKDSLYELNM